MDIKELIEEMKEVRTEHDTLTISEVLKLFEIHAIREQTEQIRLNK